MARKPKAKPEEGATRENVDEVKLAGFVNRVVEIERAFNSAKAERKDMLDDMKVEIKDGREKHGVDFKEVMRLAKIALDEEAARETATTLTHDLTVFDRIKQFDDELANDLSGSSAEDDDDEV